MISQSTVAPPSVDFPVHGIESAPEGSRPLLRELQAGLGMVPNLAAAMAESPALLRGFLGLREVSYGGTFSPAEIQILALTNAFENGCSYCMALHSAMARKEGVSSDDLARLREGRPPADPQRAALSGFSRQLVRRRGAVTAADVADLVAAGYQKSQALEVVLGVAVSILPNYAHHLTGCPVDAAFHGQLWEAPGR